MKKESCCACRFWELVRDRTEEGYQDEGLCRRQAPVAIGSPHVRYDGKEGGADGGADVGLLTAWPRTFGDSDWCGEWQVATDLGGRSKEEEAA